jgi:DNA primase
MREAPPEMLDPVVDIEKASKLDLADVVQIQEKETIRLLLNYSESQLEDKQLMNFLIEELEEIEFTNPVYKGIYDAFREGAAEGKIRDTFYFMDQGDDTVKQAVAELTTIKYETSPHWSEKYHIYFPHEKEVLQEMAYSNVLRLKFRLIQKLMLDNLESLKVAKSLEEQEEFFSVHERLKSAEKELAEILGIVISK